jgi:hypothetical protein
MAAVAREQIAAEGWRNVTVVQSPAEEADIEGSADASGYIITGQAPLRPQS